MTDGDRQKKDRVAHAAESCPAPAHSGKELDTPFLEQDPIRNPAPLQTPALECQEAGAEELRYPLLSPQC